ncbi:hypothetical protein ACROYT_G038894 [Oculina patagonica]
MVSTKHSCHGECKTDSRYPEHWPKSLLELEESGKKVFIPFGLRYELRNETVLYEMVLCETVFFKGWSCDQVNDDYDDDDDEDYDDDDDNDDDDDDNDDDNDSNQQ